MFTISKEKLQQILASGLTQDNQDSMGEFNSTKCFEDSLKCNIECGLSNDGVLLRRLEFGENRQQNQVCISRMKALWIILFKPKSMIFFSLSIISMILTYLSTDGIYTNEWIESLIIFGLICLTLMVSFKTDEEKQKQIQILDEQTKFTVVLRNRELRRIMARNLVVGDIVILQETDKIYVDGLIVEQHNLYVDQSYLTGEEEPVQKVTLEETIQSQQPISPQKHLVYAGSRVVQGCGKLLVLAVGSEAQVNKILISTEQEEQQPPITREIRNISNKMERIGFIGLIIIIIMLLARFILQYGEQNINRYSMFANILNLIIALKTGKAYETIFTHFQIQMSEAVQMMLYQQNLVRRLQKLENLAFMDTVVVDQTSILTQNRILVDSIMNDTMEQFTTSQFNLYPQQFQQALVDSCFINNYYDPNTDSGSRIEKALFEFSKKIQLNLSERVQQVTHRIPFSNARKMQTIIINNNKVAVRGSGEHILNSSTKFYSLKNGIVAIDDVLKNNIEQLMFELGQQGSIMGIAYRDVELQNENVKELIENNQFEYDRQDLTLLGFLLFVDPLRYETKSAIQGLRQAGVKVILTAGNDSISAKNFAIKAGIMLNDSTVIEGSDFSERFNRKAENSKKEIEDIHVLSGARPKDKYNLVQELQYFGHVVGACCDGENNVPILTKADVGFSLGIGGTEIDREASGIILLDDNINSVYKGLIFARNLIDSIKRIVQYLIASYFALFMILIVSVAFGEPAISPLQLIWIHLFNDLFATFALSYCKPNSQLIYQKPPNKSGFIMDENVQIHSSILSVYLIAVCILFVNQVFNIEIIQPLMVFNIYVMTTIFNLINSRMVYLEVNVVHGFFRSWISFIAILLIGVIQFVIVEYGGSVLDTFDGLSLKQWCVCVAVGIGSVAWRSIAILVIKPIVLKSGKGKLKVN
ncbi:unnamed protein product (macronuclear) [Paramecium tetraurelia]|uniref:Uncharacterized protein n=1 Tax=Paramecium tetraurelia TaxID=5888 RepID=A0E4W9_PARTE|nr:uncharacterized protein GSPATT00023512001 [Paramecium tetraurelia]CAK90336.1 unnamed protein product [Paramecium tetraurelia]|eukprot:XP_001457733.1 hypothetical protein (macronuclear) [Paramecium tetraurelia strain d4-2]